MLNRFIIYLLLVVAGFYSNCFGQRVTNSGFNLTLIPGVSTIGLDPANNYSNFTFNVLSGYQRGTYWFELSGLTSATVEQVNGIQVAGIANVVGLNYYEGLSLKDIIKSENSGEVPFANAIQISGLMNFVRGYTTGGQISLGMNISKNMMTGAQISTLLNYSNKLLTGVQLGVIGNVSKGSTNGIQVAFLNTTSEQLSGIQVGGINLTRTIEGKNSLMGDETTGIQIGLINHSKKMNGFQIGIINLSGANQGTQVGLINIYRSARKKGKLDGTPVGLLNFGSNTSLEAFIDETFQMNFALGTGNIKNAGLLPASKVKYIMNNIIYRQSHFTKHEYRGYGWNWQKQVYNFSPDIMNQFYFVSIGGGVSYVDFSNADKKTNLLTELGISAGSRIIPKNRSIYLYATLDANYFYSNDGHTLGPEKFKISLGEDDLLKGHELWLGLSIGLKITS